MSRVLLAGNNEAACLVLDLLLEALPPGDVLAVVPPGGVHHAWQPSLERHAAAHGVPVLAPLDVNDDATIAAVASHQAELLLSVYYTQLFGERLLAGLQGPAINFHPSLLPRHRGVAPLIWAIAEGDTMIGVTAHHIDAGIDTGRVVAQRKLPVHPDDTGHTLHRKAARLVCGIAAELLRGWLSGEGIPEGDAQSGRATSHSTRDPQLNRIDFAQPRERIRDIVRALAPPLPGAWCEAGDRRLVLAQVTPVDAGSAFAGTPGMLARLPGGDWGVWAADGLLRIDAFHQDGEARPSADLLGVVTEGQVAA
jgi:methionyl-tRNA formyltransferase